MWISLRDFLHLLWIINQSSLRKKEDELIQARERISLRNELMNRDSKF